MAQEKFIDSKEATLIRLKYADQDAEVLLEQYQEYLDEEEEDPDDPLPFEDWLEDFLEDEKFFKSPEWQEEMSRLGEKD
jgi:hypothetical protein